MVAEALEGLYSSQLKDLLTHQRPDEPENDNDGDDVVPVEEPQENPPEDPRNGFERGLKADCILFFLLEPELDIEDLLTTGSEKAFGAVRFFESEEIEAISFKEIRKHQPQILRDYFKNMHELQKAKSMDVNRKSEVIPLQEEDLERIVEANGGTQNNH